MRRLCMVAIIGLLAACGCGDMGPRPQSTEDRTPPPGQETERDENAVFEGDFESGDTEDWSSEGDEGQEQGEGTQEDGREVE